MDVDEGRSGQVGWELEVVVVLWLGGFCRLSTLRDELFLLLGG